MAKELKTTASIIKWEFTREEVQHMLLTSITWPIGYTFLRMTEDNGAYNEEELQTLTLEFIKEG